MADVGDSEKTKSSRVSRERPCARTSQERKITMSAAAATDINNETSPTPFSR